MSFKPQNEASTDPATVEEDGWAVVTEKRKGETESGGSTEKEFEGLSAVAATPSAGSSCLSNKEQQAPKNRRGRPRKVSDILKKDIVTEERSIKISVNSIQQQHVDSEQALENGNPFDQLLRGISRQEQRFISCSTDKHGDPFASPYALAREEPATAERKETLFVQDNCPPPKSVYHIHMSDIDTPYHLKTGERVNKQSCPVTEERSVVPLMLGVNQTCTVLHQDVKNPLTTLNKKDEKETQDIRTAGSLPQTGYSLCITPPICEKVDFTGVDNPPNQQDPQTVTSGRNVVKEMTGVKYQPSKLNCFDSDHTLFQPDCMHGVRPKARDTNEENYIGMSSKPEVKIRRKVGRPPKNKTTTKTHLVQDVDCFQNADSGKSKNCTQDISIGETATTACDKSKKNAKKRDTISHNAVKVKSAVKRKTSKIREKVLNSDGAEIQSPGSVQTEFTTLISTSVKEKKKVGRPKKCINTTNETLDAVTHVSASFKKAVKSPHALPGRQTLVEADVCTERRKRSGRGHQAESSLSQVTAEQQPAKKLCEKNSVHKINRARSLGGMQGADKMESTEVMCGLQDRTTSNPNGPLSQNQPKCGHQKNMPTELEKGRTAQALSPSPKTFLEQAGHIMSKEDSIAHLEKLKHRKRVFSDKHGKSPDLRIAGSAESLLMSHDLHILNKRTGSDTLSDTKDSLKAVKEEGVVVEERGETGDVLVGFKASSSSLKLKRKIGRPFKKKTLIKMAKQLVIAQEERINAKEMDLIPHPETGTLSQDITYTGIMRSKLKKEKRKDLWLQDTHLRRYTRACKSAANDTVKKHRVHSKSSKAVLSPSSGLSDPLLVSENTLNAPVVHSSKPEFDNVVFSKGDLLKPLRKKKKYQEVKIKVEETHQPVFRNARSASKMQNSDPFQIVPGLSQETVTGCDSVFTFGETQSKGWDLQRKAGKIENEQSQIINTICQNTPTPTKLLLMPEFKSDVAGKDLVNETARNMLEMKNRCDVKAGRPQENECVHILHSALSNMSGSRHSTPKYLPPPQDTAASLSNKVPRKRGRPRKTVLTQDLKKETDSMYSVKDPKCSVLEPHQSKSLETLTSPLNVSSETETKKAHKVDRRRKRFRNQKALVGVRETENKTCKTDALLQIQELIASQSEQPKLEAVALKNFSEDFASPGNAWPVKSLCIAETGRMSSVQQSVEGSGTNQFTKWQKKAGSRKRRRRKRSWWDDRGKIKVEPLEKKLESAAGVSLQSNEKQTGTEVGKTAKNKKMSAKQMDALRRTNQHGKAAEVAIQSQLLTRESESGVNILTAESSEVRKHLKTVSVDDKDSELCNLEKCAEKPLANDMNQLCYVEKDNGISLAVVDSINTVESCKKVDGNLECDSKGKAFSDSKVETGKCSSVATNAVKLDMGALEVVAEDFGQKPERPKKRKMQSSAKELQQRDAVSPYAEQKVQRGILKPTESEIPGEANKNSPKAVAMSKTVPPFFSDPSDEKVKTKDQFSQLFSEQLLDSSAFKEVLQSVDQSMQEAGRSGTDQNGGRSISEVPRTSESSKPRGPGRPPRCQEKKPIECSYCGRTFHHISSYIIHRRVHTGERPYSCQECGKTFAQRSNLNTHRKVHKQAELLQCPYCSSRFSDRDKLLEHCKIHNLDPNLSRLTGKFRNERTDVEVQPKSRSVGSSIAPKDAKPHVCEVCGKGFRFFSMLKIHLRVHSGEKPYSCKVCGKSFSQACSVRVHEKIHWSVKPYVCTVCGKGFAQLGTLKAHLCTHIGDNKAQEVEQKAKSPITFQCHICKKSFGLRHQYNLHIRNHGDFQTYTCDTCGQKYTQVSDLDIHRQTCLKYSVDGASSVDTTAKPGQASYSPQKSQTEGDKHLPAQTFPYSQSKSYQKFDLPAHEHPNNQGSKPPRHGALNETAHIQTHSFKPSQTLTYPNHADASALQASKMNAHQRSPLQHCLLPSLREHRKSDPRKYLCPRCGRLFRHLGRLRAHMLTHARGLSYTCSRCGKTLENWNKFWLHQRVHREKRGRFFCNECGRGFRFAGPYRKHLQEHTEKKPYLCHLCPYTCSCEEVLKSHHREWHGSPKPYRCNICQKDFFHQKNLERHFFLHHQVQAQSCPLCGVSFLHPSEFQLHLRTHENVKFPLGEVSPQTLWLPYQCGWCDASFETVNLLFQHQLCHSSPDNMGTWQSGHIVGQVSRTFHPQMVHQHDRHKSTSGPVLYFQPEVSSVNIRQNKYFSPYQNKCSVDAVSPASAPLIPYYNRSSADLQDSCPISSSSPLTYSEPSRFCKSFSQHEGNKMVHPASPHSMADGLPQTPSSSAAVPFSKPSSPYLPNQSSPLIHSSTCPPSQPGSQVQVSSYLRTEPRQLAEKELCPSDKSVTSLAGCSSSCVNGGNEEDLEEDVECTECGEQFSDVPQLYEHYLQHARGEL